ncbi:MAG: chitobiase/beta-hexosaminidase C-terminal domain-containing protein [Prevotella sp.]|nr:chitobiase/beta-hexosaminidase C-terminal domain-containing protein [Prevotella sp.]MBR6276273.1 chitobiase/beta-hexosaminidase C-terminal domain-containing protein [Prevotella sp.]
MTPSVTAPTISGETQFTDTTQVSISGPASAEIRYTTDGSTPTAESTLYSEPFTLSDTATVKAIAIKDGVSSQVSTKSFTKGSGGGGSNGGGNDVN